MKKNHKIVAGGTAILLALGLGLAAVGSTSAYFSDTNTGGKITITAGELTVDTDGNKVVTPNLEYVDVMPGDTVSKEVEVTNSGTIDQDVYLMVDPAELAKTKTIIAGKGDLIISVDGTEVARLSKMGPEVLLTSGLAAGDTAVVTFTLDTNEAAPGQVKPQEVNLSYSIVATQTGDQITPA